MTSDLPPPIGFDDLRAEAIPAAQRASGDIWTDYNIHDPGVTLLEQTCFALTEIAYRGDHSARDLLTSADGSFDPEALALFGPEQVLPGRPVTALDLAAGLSALTLTDRVFVHPTATRGLLDIYVVPASGIPDEDAIAAVREAFGWMRLIGTDINRIEVAKRLSLDLSGRISISAFANPNAIAAEIYHLINLNLHGLGASGTGGREGATRGDVFNDPAAIWAPVSAEPGKPARIDLALAALEQIAGVESVQHLALLSAATGAPVARSPGHGVVCDIRLPTSEGKTPLEFILNGSPVPLDPDAIGEEYDRIVAAHIARQGNRLDPHDFDVMTPGRPRSIPSIIDADATLPAIYRLRKDDHEKSYRRTINAHLGAVTAPLGALPHIYIAKRPVDLSNPADIRRRIEMLDYLIALQGEEMPETSQSGINLYRGTAEKCRWNIRWREEYLAKLPQMNFFQGTVHPEYGTAARIAHLADLQLQRSEDELKPLQDLKVELEPAIELPEPTVDRASLLLPYRPTDMLLQRDARAAQLSSAELREVSPWIRDAATTPDLYRRAADPGAYFLARDRNSDWQLLFEPEEGAVKLYACASGRDRAEMETLGNRLCNSWQALNSGCEAITLIEDIHLRSGMIDFRNSSATALLTGWTARTARPAYRRYVEDIILRVAPAHVYVRPVWLSLTAQQELLPLITAWRSGEKYAGGALRAVLVNLPHECAP